MQSRWHENTTYRRQLFRDILAQTAILLSFPASLLLLSPPPPHTPHKSDDMLHTLSPSSRLPLSSLHRQTPTQRSRHCGSTGMWPCMSYRRLICHLMGNVLFSRSRRGDRFKSWSEITFSFFSLFPPLTEEHGVFTLPTDFTATPPPPHSASLLSDKGGGGSLISPPTHPHSLFT